MNFDICDFYSYTDISIIINNESNKSLQMFL